MTPPDPDLFQSLADLTPEQRALLVLRMRQKAARREPQASAAPPLRPVPRPEPPEIAEMPLSFAQQRLWFMEQWQPGSAAYNIPAALRIAGRLDVEAFRWSLDEIVRRHEVLRVRIAAGRPVQAVLPPGPLSVPMVDLSAVPEPARAAEVRRQVQEEALRPFQLTRDPLLRAMLLRLGAAEHVAIFNMHHIVSDGWSIGVLVGEFTALYAARIEGLPAPLPELPVQYPDYAAWQRRWLSDEVLETQLAYWRRMLDGAPAAVELPLARPRPPRRTTRSGRGSRQPYRFPSDTTGRLRALSRSESVTLFMTLLAGFDALLHRHSGETDLVVGSPVAGRHLPEVEGLIGFFVNNLALRVNLSGDPTFRELLDRVRDVTLDAQAHQELPFEKLVEELRPERDTSRPPIFQVVLSLQNTPPMRGDLPQVDVSFLELEGATAQYDLMLSVLEGQSLGGYLEYSTDLFDAPAAARLLEHLQTLLAGATADPDRRLSELPLLAEPERWQLLGEWNDTAETVASACFHQTWAERAALWPDAVAVACGDERLTYGELDRRGNRLAHHLRALGIGPEVPVGLAVERSVEMVVGVLGIWKAGGAYVPLDPAYPEERLAVMLEETALLVIVTQERLLSRLPRFFGFTVSLDGEWDTLAAYPDEAPDSGVLPGSLAYVIFTSGSTGRPKGTLLPHAGLLHLARAHERIFETGPGENLLLFAPLAFDASVFDLVMALGRGNTLHLVPQEEILPGPSLLRLLEEREISSLTITPSALAALPSASLPALRRLWVAGEACTPELVARWAACRRFFNAYGPTEATVWVTVEELASADTVPPIGRPVANRRVQVLDGQLQPVPAGGVGELYAGGAGLARGYLGRPDLTAERFVPDPFQPDEPGARLYRTGDLVRRLPDGRLEFAGRRDSQVKVRGIRIELGEIEAALASHPCVREAAVVTYGEGEDRRLAAFVVADGPAASAADLREALRERLPEVMVPSSFTVLPELPRTANDKLDRRVLVDLAARGQAVENAGHEVVSPRTPAQELAVRVLAEVLGVERVGLRDSFFDLGGHSLLATQILSRVREAFGVEVSLTDFFAVPTAEGLAACCEVLLRSGRSGDGAVPEAPPLRPSPPGVARPLSFAQQRLWFLNQLEPESAAYNIPGGLRLSGKLSVPALAGSLGEVIRRHEVLRTIFPELDGRPVLAIEPWQPLALPVVDLAALPEPAREAEAGRLGAAVALRPFDLARGPLARLLLLRFDASEHALLFTMHHVVADGWSMGVLVRELTRLYPVLLAGTPSPLPELPVQYADFAAWQRDWLCDEALESRLAYWRRRLAGAPATLDLPADRSRPAMSTSRGGWVPLHVESRVAEELQALSRRQGATLFMTLLAAFQVLLSRLAGQDDVCVGTPIAGRNRMETEGLIGFFVNTLVLRGELREEDLTFERSLARARQTALEAYAHQDVPFERLVEELRPERALSHSPLFQVMFALQNAPGEALELPGLALSSIGVERGTTIFDLTLDIGEALDGLRGGVEHSADLFDAVTIERWVAGFNTLLAGICADPSAVVWDLPLLAESERLQVLEWGTGPTVLIEEPRSETSLHGLFQAQVEKTPEAVALIDGELRLTYRELAGRAGRLAAWLRAAGVAPEERVGLCARRSHSMVAGLLAILEAGGAYVPLDPTHPRPRLGRILADARPIALLLEERLGEVLPDHGLPVIGLDSGSGGPVYRRPGVEPDNLAYLIYTSGSTGEPKGVAIQHRSAVAMVRWAWDVFPDEDLAGVLFSTSINFDLSVFELFVPLSRGGTVVLADDALALPSLPAAGEVTLINTVPSAMAGLLRLGGLPPSLRTVNLAGEPLTRELAGRIHELPQVERLFNLYGPSEDTTYSTFARIGSGGEESPSIGRPVAGTRAWVLDRRLRPVPLGVPGELCLGGVGLARGYFGRPDLTAERWVPDPLSDRPGERLYRTGDLVRWSPDGNLQFLGRLDHQVKVRGYRIELGEIETALAAAPGVREAVVVTRGEGGSRTLVACVVPAAGEGDLSPASLRDLLRGRLPEPMVPSAFLAFDILPLTSTGKVDRRELSRLAAEVGVERAELATTGVRTPAEEMLAAIWGEVLGLDRVGLEESFFELGGHSLLATQVVSRVRTAFGIELPLRQLFETPTVAGFARRVETALRAATGSQAPPIRPVPRDAEGLPLSFAQERLWFVDRLQPGTATYNMVTAADLEGDLDAGALARSLDAIVARHEALRTRFPMVDGHPAQVIDPPPAWTLPVVDLSGLPDDRRGRLLREIVDEESVRPFDLAAGPLLRALLLRRGPAEHVAFLATHHIVSDGWSMMILVRELTSFYAAFTTAAPPSLPALPIQYADFAQWQRSWLRGEVLESQLAFWRERLAGAPAVTALPLDRPRPAVQAFHGESLGVLLDGGLTEGLRALSRRAGTTLFMTLLASFDALLHRWTGESDLVVGTPSANRNREEIEGLIGFFVNSLVLRADLSGAPSFLDLMAQIRETTLAAYAHQDLPFEKLVSELRPERDLSHTPVFQVLIQLQNVPASTLELPGLVLRFPEVETRTAKFDLTLNLNELQDGLACEWRYNTELFDGPTLLRLAHQFETLLKGLVAEPGRPTADLPWFTEPELHQVVVEWNDSALALNAGNEEVCFPELFDAQAGRTPDAVAVARDGWSLTYGELARRADRAAGLLASLGVGPDSVVALLAERGPELLLAILAIQKAGGAWLPLDPSHPESRIAHMIERSGARCVIAGEGVSPLPTRVWEGDGKGGQGVRTLHLDDLISAPEGTARRAVHLHPENIAYIIYTSGSTGTPKGVMVKHLGMLNHLWSKVVDLRITAADSVAQNASQTFDISVWQFLSALLVGGRTQVIRDEEAQDPARLLEATEREQVTVLELVPSLLGAVCEVLEGEWPPARPRLAALRWLIPTGEALPPELCRRWLALYPEVPMVNAYGPTECSDEVTHAFLPEPLPAGTAITPIGRPIPNLRLHVTGRLADGLRPAPIGVTGELCVSGTGVGRGYKDDPARTAEAFVPDPFAGITGDAGSRLYRTGDLARFLPDGRLEYLGRRDRQVKVRGFRIETGEIEAALLAHPAVREAVVQARRPAGSTGAELALAAWVSPRPGNAVEVAELRAFLRERLPEYMVPAAFVLLDAMPLTPNGKVNLRALPDPDAATEEAGGSVVVPRTPLETVIAEVWREVLGEVRFGVHDNFFELGGDSIKGAILMHRLQRRLGEVLYVVTLFDAPTVAGLAAHLQAHYPEAVARLLGGGAAVLVRSERIGDAEVAELRRRIPSLPPPPAGFDDGPRNPPAVFVLSPPRAGSTLLRVLLGGHPDLFSPPELELLSFHSLAERRDAFTGRNSFWLEGALRAVVQLRGCGPDEARELVEELELHGVSTRRFFAMLQEWMGGRTLVDKTPSYALDLEVLRRAETVFEGARYIHLVRHPAASIRSFEEAHLDQVFFRHKHPFTARQLAELIWTISQENIVAFLDEVPAERQHRVVFEDLVREPRPVLEGICRFLGIPFHPEMERPYADASARMTDGLHAVSRMLGDVRFHEHDRIDPEVARRKGVSEEELGEPTRRVARALGYALPLARRLASIEPRSTQDGPPPLSFAQERLWFLQQLEPAGTAYNMPNALRLRGRLDVAALDRAVREVVRRHETLRTRFALHDGFPVPVVEPDPAALLPLVDLTALPEAMRSAEAERVLAAEVLRPFDLERGPVARHLLLRLASEEHAVLFAAHHIACDGWSLGLWAREVEVFYKDGRLPEPPVQYADFAAWQRSWLVGDELAAQVGFWRERLHGAPPFLDLPADHPRPPVQTFRGDAAWTVLPGGLLADLKGLASRHNASLFMVLLTAFQLHLGRLAGQDDVVVGSPIAGRVPEVEGLIGCFLNTLALRADLSGDPSFAALLGRMRETALAAYAHQDVPFEKLLQELRPERDLSRTSLFQVLFNMLNAPGADVRFPGLEIEPLGLSGTAAKFDLTLYIAERGDGLILNLVYNSDLFDRSRMEEMLRQYRGLLGQAVADPDAAIGRYTLLTPEAIAVLPDPAAELTVPWPGAAHELVAEQARLRPGHSALVDRDGTWTYAELDLASRCLAARLLAEGIEPGDRVAIYAHRGAALAWAVLGVLRAGAVFVLLDPAVPAPRLVEVLRLAGPRGWLRLEAAGPLPEILADYVSRAPFACRLDLPSAPLDMDQPLPGSWPAVGPDDAACLAFTSGSTGEPKGILQTHGGMTGFLPWHEERLGYVPSDRHTMLSGLAHDPLQRDLFYCLGSGGTLCIPDPGRIGEPGWLAGWMRRERVTVTNLTPAMAQLLTEPAGAADLELPELRCAVLGGDVLTRQDAARLRRLAPNAPLVNVYGSTESHRALSFHFVEEDDRGRQVIPLGVGQPGSQLLVLTRGGSQAGVGELGEIAIRSPRLAAGYWRDEALTRERFAAGLYRTGDLGRYLPNGEVEAAGRADQQVKVRGYRVEPGEVEAELCRLPGVRAAAVAGREDGRGGRRLVAWVVLDPAADQAALRDRLRERLPAYMVPSVFVEMEKLPLNPSGKVDRRALPEPVAETARVAGAERVPPRDALELRLARIWEEVLGIPSLGVTDSFFDLGGHSLLAVGLTARIAQDLGRTLPLAALFQAPTVADLAALLRREGTIEESTLVALQPGGSRPPLFLVHPIGGQAFGYVELARLLGPDQPVYALQDVAPPEAPRSLAGLASRYLREVRAVQPGGPYLLAGWSFGGRVAWEMSRQLDATGEEVALLGMIDTGLVAPPARPNLDDAALLAEVVGDLPLTLEELRREADPLAALIERAREAGTLPPGTSPETARRLLGVLKAHLEVARTDRPRPYHGKATFFAAAEQPAEIAADPSHGWGELAGELELVRVPGDHVTLITKPENVRVLARRLEEAIEAAVGIRV